MKLKIIFLLLLSSRVWAGGSVGNGGDTVFCEKSMVSAYSGYYNLDYLLNKIYETQFSNEFESVIRPSDPAEANFERILQVSSEAFPTFAQNLKAFYQDIYKNSIVAPYTWKKAPFGLIQLNDENLRIVLPPNCLSQNPNNPFIQTIVRDVKPFQTEFTYYTTALDKLNSLQRSFLLFHEWLWNYTDDPEIVRNANAIFHSKDWGRGNVRFKMAQLLRTGLNTNILGNSTVSLNFLLKSEGLAMLENCSLYTSGYRCYVVGDSTHIKIKNERKQYAHFIKTAGSDMGINFVVAPGAYSEIVLPKVEFHYCVFYSDSPNLNVKRCDLTETKPDFVFYTNP